MRSSRPVAHQPLGAAAFSLIELTLVLAIMAVIAAVATPRYTHALARYRAEATARRVVTDLHTAQRVARQTSRAHTVTFDRTADTITYALPARDGQSRRKQVTRLGGAPYHGRLVSVNFDGNRSVTFDGFGQPDSGGTVVVAAHGRRRTVVLDGASGDAVMR